MADVALVIKKVLNAAPEEVFKAWTDPTEVAKWYGPEGFTNTIHEMDVREGGKYRLIMHAPNGEEHPLRGEFKEIQAPKKLAMTWEWENPGGMEGMGGETLVVVEFSDIGGKTEMIMTHSRFESEKAKENHSMGWTSSFGKLEKLLA